MSRRVFDTEDGTLTVKRLGYIMLVGAGLWLVLLAPIIWWAS